jgi:hypothetical protein
MYAMVDGVVRSGATPLQIAFCRMVRYPARLGSRARGPAGRPAWTAPQPARALARLC